jgi:2-polyprenyl-3-methyl-5-hydroxy-6-metoxy-1,4-benzoquinol methylase
MKSRSHEPERLDLETPPPELRARIAGYLAFVNRWLGGTRAVAHHLRKVTGGATVLDVASGAGDILRDLSGRFPHLNFVAFDLSEWMLALGSGIPRIRGDVRRFPFRDRSVDYVICTHFFHHLPDDQIVATLREFDRVARRGIIVNDLHRNRRALFWIRLFTLWANPYVKCDGPLSVKKAFKVPEVEALARRAGLDWLKVRLHFGHRFTLAGLRPGWQNRS